MPEVWFESNSTKVLFLSREKIILDKRLYNDRQSQSWNFLTEVFGAIFMMHAHTFEAIFGLIATWLVLAILAGIGLSRVMRPQEYLFGFAMPRLYHQDRLFGFVVPKQFRRA